MRKLIFLSLLILSYISCNEGPSRNATSTEDQLHLPKVLNGIYFGGVKLPNGTTTSLNEEGGVNFSFPSGVFFAGINSRGEVIKVSSSCYSCTSTCSTGCDVVLLGDEVGCSECKNSDAECKGKRCKSELMVELRDGGFINLSNGIKIIDKKQADGMEKLASPTIEVLFQIPEVNEKLEDFYRNVWKDEAPSEGNYNEVLVNLFGSVATFYVPKEYELSSARLLSEGVSCSCSSGSTGCTLEEIKKFGAVIGHKCKAGSCTSCEMSYPEK